MVKRRLFWGKRVCPVAVLLVFILAVGCAEVQVRTLPSPPPTPKIRVFVEAITGPGRWKMPAEEFAKGVPRYAKEVLMETSIFEVADFEDSKSVLGDSRPLTRWEWAKRDWELARKAGRGLHADYAIIVARSMHKGYVFWEMTFLNVATGKKYRSVSRTSMQPYLHVEDYAKMFKINYRAVFQEAKGDVLATAIQKSHTASLVTPVQPAPGPVKGAKEAKALPSSPEIGKGKSPDPGRVPPVPAPPSPAPSSSPVPQTPAPPPPQVSSPAAKEEPFPLVSKEIGASPEELEGVKVLDLGKILAAESKPDGRKRLVVYDLETTEPLKVVGLILSEALREELIRLGHFALVNRENLVQVLKEIDLQMTGLVDEKQAVRAGKGLGASQIIMGRYGALGKTSVLQAKRVDVESQGTLAMGSLKCSPGQEDDLLARMSELARKLAGGN